MAQLHATAIVSPEAAIGDGVEIGAYSVIGPHVSIGSGSKIMPHVVIEGHTTLGKECRVFPFASLGTQTQDLKFEGGVTRVEVGDGTIIREYVTINSATADGDITKVGRDCLIMAYAHVAHDCVIGDRVIIANCGTLAGHVIIEDEVIIGGLCGVHQFVRLGRMCIIGGCSKVTQDVPPFMMADGHPLKVRGINAVGLKRRRVDEDAAKFLKQLYKILYRQELTTQQALDKIERDVPARPEVEHVLEFIRESERGITK